MSAWICPASLISLWYLGWTAVASGELIEQKTNLPLGQIAQHRDIPSNPLQNEKKPPKEPVDEEAVPVTELSTLPPPSNLRILEDFGAKNQAVQVQRGEGLTSWIRQELGSHADFALTIQVGTNLFAAIRQAGELHRAHLFQRGDHLSLSLVQENRGNKAHVEQTGSHLSARVIQSAVQATVFVSQMGTRSSVAVTQQ